MARATKKQVTPREKQGKVQASQVQRAPTPFEEMERFFDNLERSVFSRRWLRPFQREWPSLSDLAAPFGGRAPRIDVIDRDNEVVVRAELPGVEKKDLDVSMTDETVTIKASAYHEEKEEEGDYYHREISRGEFSRTVSLPAAVDGAKAAAVFKDGILELTLPKIHKARRHKVKVA